MKPYHDLMSLVLEKGEYCPDRTGVGTYNYFGTQMRFDLSKGFPLLTTKKLWWKAIVNELLWFLKGGTDLSYLKEKGIENIWKFWADENGQLGPIYGAQWRNWTGLDAKGNPKAVDQIKEVVDKLKNNPHSRRNLVSAWNVTQLDDMALPPCHTLFQFFTSNNKLSCQLYQRSVDVFIGLPFNIACYSLLTHMLAQVCGLEVGEFIHTGGVVHIYSNHLDACSELLKRDSKEYPTVKLNPDIKNIDDFKEEDFTLENYNPHPIIKAPVAI